MLRSIKITAFVLLTLLSFSTESFAIRLKGKLPSGVDKIISIPGEQVTTSATDSTIDTSEKKKFNLRTPGNRTRLVMSVDDKSYPVLLGVESGGKYFSVKKALKKNLCSDGTAKGVTVMKRSVRGLRSMRFKLDSDDGYAYVQKVKGLPIAKVKRFVDRDSTVTLNTDCSPLGNATTFGLATNGTSSININAANGDTDADGMPDEVDSDADGDGVLNNYDSDTSVSDNSFRVFSNLKVSLEDTINTNTGSSPTQEQIDALVSGTTTLAIEVKGDADAGDVSELDGGTLSYLSAGGTGKKLSDDSDFPGTAGGANDTDSDGLGEIEKGSTNDFQLKPGADTSSIAAGDTFSQVVTTSDGTETFIATLDFIFQSTPAIKTIQPNPADASPVTPFTISYPVSSSGQGTANNCFTVADGDDGNVQLEITAWRPQRPGVSGVDPATVMDIGNSLITIDIPNAPCASSTSGGCSGNGPGNCPIASYSESDTNLSISGDTLLDGAADAAANTANTVTFTSNVSACLLAASQTLASGQKVFLDLQFRNSTGDNAAQKFCIQKS